MLDISAFGRKRQEGQEFKLTLSCTSYKASLDYMTPCLDMKTDRDRGSAEDTGDAATDRTAQV